MATGGVACGCEFVDDSSSLRVRFGGGAAKIGFGIGCGRSAGGVLKKLGVKMFSRRSEAGGAFGIGGAIAVRGIG